jgi:hypothetical protein
VLTPIYRVLADGKCSRSVRVQHIIPDAMATKKLRKLRSPIVRSLRANFDIRYIPVDLSLRANFDLSLHVATTA